MQARPARFTVPRGWPWHVRRPARAAPSSERRGARPTSTVWPARLFQRWALPRLSAPALVGLAAFLLVLLPGLLASELIVRSYQARLTDDARTRTLAGLDGAAGLVDTERTRTLNNAELAGSRLGLAVAQESSPDDLLKAAADLRGSLRTSMVALVDGNGKTLASDPASNLPFGTHWETRQALGGKAVVALQERTPGFAVEAAAPLRVDGQIVPGAALVAQNLDDGFLMISPRLTGLEIGLVQNGRLVAASRGIRRSFAYASDQSLDGELLASGPDRFKAARFGSESFFLAARTLMSGQREIGTVLVGLPSSTADDAVAWARTVAWLAAGVGAVAAGLLGLWAGWWHQRRAQLLAARVRAIGEGVTLERGATSIRPDPIWGVLDAAVDRTGLAVERRLAEQRLHANRLTAVLGSLDEGIIVADERHRVILTNAVARRLLNLPADGSPDGLAGAAPSTEDGDRPSSERVIRSYSAPVLDDADMPLGYVTVLRDATREQEGERLRSELLGVVSHELQTPLTAIKGALELVVDEDEGGLSRVQRRFLGTIERNTGRLIVLVGDLLDLSRLDAGRLQLDLRPLDTRQVVDGCVSSLSNLFEGRGQTVRVAAMDELPPLLGDRRRVEQIVTNLLANAAKYTPAGGIVEVSAHVEGNRVAVVVSDSGPGIPEAERELIFDRFYRGRDATRQGEAGSGLGLAIVRSLVELHGGSARAEAPPPGSSLRGAQFVVELPRAPDDE